MRDDHDDGGLDDDDALAPLQGNINAFRNEQARLERFAEGLEDLSEFIRNARMNGWTGAAADSAVEAQKSITAACLRGASSHASAAKALNTFTDALAVLQPMTASLIVEAHTGTSLEVRMAARASIRRFRAQLAETRREVADKLARAAEDLQQLHSVLPDLPAMPAFTVPPLVFPPVSPSPVSLAPADAPDRPEPPAPQPEPPVVHTALQPSSFRFGDPSDRRFVVLVNNLFLRAVREAC